MKNLFLIATVLAFTSLANADICGKTDDRALSFDSKVGRLAKEGEHQGCAATLVGRSCVITVGACAEDRDYVEFNPPVSIAGIPQASTPEDTYYVKKGSAVFKQKGIGSQWAVMQLEPNRVTNKFAGDVQGFYQVAHRKYQNYEPIRVVGYGYALNDTDYVRSGDVAANTFGDSMNFAQQVSYGRLVKAGIFLIPEIVEHDADTSYGSWGAPIISQITNEIVGISTHGGCQAKYVVKAGARYTNSGTATFGSRSFRNAIAACLAK
ncbi:trypsin-like serine protease [Bdellovibrio sp. HCB-110]|uniref:trypsin-like serine protease n=1 Tax=Bdellovibrio sp. HCB-110 TaxID=3391182 RepID=UPI0039B6C358